MEVDQYQLKKFLMKRLLRMPAIFLAYVYLNEPTTMREICKKTPLSWGWAEKIFFKLKEAKLVDCERQFGKVGVPRKIFLTEKGKKVAKHIVEIITTVLSK